MFEVVMKESWITGERLESQSLSRSPRTEAIPVYGKEKKKEKKTGGISTTQSASQNDFRASEL